MRNKKIVFAANTGWYLFNFRRNLIEHLAQKGFEVILVAPIDRYLSELSNCGYATYPIKIDSKSQNPIKDLITSVRFLQLLVIIKPAVVFSFTVKPNIYLGFTTQLLRIPLISTVTGLGTAFIAGGSLQRIVVGLYRVSQRRCSAMVFQNQDDEMVFERLGIGRGRRKALIPGSGVNVDHFYRSEYLHLEHKKIVFVGRFLYDKGIRELIQAAKIISCRHQGQQAVTFQFLGGMAPENRTSVTQDEIKEWQKCSFIEFLDWVEDIRPVIQAAYCVVLPSYREGLPRTLIEAGAIGRPVIATDVAGCRQVVIDGENGLLCAPRSSYDLVIKIEQMLKFNASQWGKMADCGRRRVEKYFNESVVMDRYYALLSEIQS